MEKDLICSQCNQQYRQNNVPRLLPKCGHSFCQNCIRLILDSLPDSAPINFVCPDDDASMQFEDKDINNFPKNIALLKMLNAKESKKKDESFKDGSLNESNIAKHSAHEADEEDKQLITAINESTKSTEYNNYAAERQVLELNLDDTCLIHQKPLEIVCIRDKTKICSTCAIFGDHKGHDFKSIDEVAKDKSDRCDAILNLIDLKETLQNSVSGKDIKDTVNKAISDRREALCKQVRDRFGRLIDLLKVCQKRTLDKVNSGMKVVEERLMQDLKIPDQLNKKYIKWEERAYRQIKAFDGQNNFQEQLKILNYEKAKDHIDVIEEGTCIIQQIDTALQSSQTNRFESVSSITLDFNPQLEKKIQDYATVKDNKKESAVKQNIVSPVVGTRQSAPPKFKDIYDPVSVPLKKAVTQRDIHSVVGYANYLEPTAPHNGHNPDDFLLEAHGDASNQEMEEPIVREVTDMPTLNIRQPEPPRQPFGTMTPTSLSIGTPQSSRRIERNATVKQTSFVLDKAPSKRKPKIKLPEKYQKILDGIINDQLEAVDFTGAELGDQVMVQISEYMRGKKVKTLKLIRNKLTDQALQKMLPNLTNIITLNLSQNLFTDRAIDHILSHLSKLTMLKSIILSQNKIKERSVKTRVQEIKKSDIVVSL